jgi:hypothetical protein
MITKDIISRDTLKRPTTDVARHLLGIDGEAVELLETQNQRIEDRRADLVARMRTSGGEAFLLQMLSQNRELKAQVEEAERMLTEIDIEALPSFAIGFGRGEARAKQRVKQGPS